jgi:methyl-accepting chemotaxis protein
MASMKLPRIKLSLRLQVALMFVALIVVLYGAMGAYSINQQSNRIADQMRSRMNQIATLQAGSVAGSLWNMDYKSVEQALATLKKDKDFQYASVVEKSGNTAAKLGSQRDTALSTTVPVKKGGDKLGTLTLQFSREPIRAQRAQAIQSTAIETGITLIVLVAAMMLSLNRVLKPVGRITNAMTAVAEDENEVTIPYRKRDDEVGAMARAVAVFQQNNLEMKRMREEQAEMERRQAEEAREARRKLADSFEETVKSSVRQMLSASENVAHEVDNMQQVAASNNEKAEQALRESEGANESVQTVASTTEELTTSVREISDNAQQSTEVSNDAVQRAKETQETVSNLQQSAQKISEVVTLINDIAEQTNLLALNATIEAARAGEAGKGFAVVANEVKNLANQTGKATEDIRQQIQDVQSVTDTAVEQMNNIMQIINRMNEYVSGIAGSTQEQDTATREIAQSAQSAASSASVVRDNLSAVNDATSQNAEKADTVAKAMHDLTRQLNTLGEEADSFLSRIREA